MVSPFTLPPTGFGPGSQPDPDGELQYMPMPSGMRTYAPHVPSAGDAAAKAETLVLLEVMAEACDRVAAGGPVGRIDLASLTPPARRLMAEALGQGEVSLKVRGTPAVMVQESVFAGVWMLLAAGLDAVDIAPVPPVALARAHQPHRPGAGSGRAACPALPMRPRS